LYSKNIKAQPYTSN